TNLEDYPRTEYATFAREFQKLLVTLLGKKIRIAEDAMYFQDRDYEDRINNARTLFNQLNIGAHEKPRSNSSAWLEEFVKNEISNSDEYKQGLARKQQRDSYAAEAAKQAE